MYHYTYNNQKRIHHIINTYTQLNHNNYIKYDAAPHTTHLTTINAKLAITGNTYAYYEHYT